MLMEGNLVCGEMFDICKAKIYLKPSTSKGELFEMNEGNYIESIFIIILSYGTFSKSFGFI